jgi:hypothetical protein
LRLPISVSVEIADGILNLAFRRKQYSEDMMIAEAKRVIRAYLAGHLG